MKPIIKDPSAHTISEAFGFEEEKFNLLVRELTRYILDDDRLVSLETYLNGPLFKKYSLNLSDPSHAAILGYAFCAAIFTKRTLQSRAGADALLDAFYPERKKTVN